MTPITIVSLVISGLSLALSFFVTSTNFWSSRAKIKVIQTDNFGRSAILNSYDGSTRSFSGSLPVSKDVLLEPQMESIALAEIIITNESSLPISILEFEVDHAAPFTSYSHTKAYFMITTGENHTIHFGYSKDPIKYLKPEFTLQPYTSDRGYLLLWMHHKDAIPLEKAIPLKITTSRGVIIKTIYFSNKLESIKPHTSIRNE